MLQNMVLGPLSRTLGLVIIFAVFSLTAGSVNGWYLLAEDSLVYNETERFDRFLVLETTDDDADDAWTDDSNVVAPLTPSTGAVILKDTKPLAVDTIYNIGTTYTSPTCIIGTVSSAVASGDASTAQTIVTPLGSEIVIPAVNGDGSNSIDIKIPDCEWQPSGDIFNAGGLSGLISLILQAAGLGLPIGALIGLASFGNTFVQKLGLSPLMGAIVMVIGFLLVGTLLNVLTPFIDDAFGALDGDRFKMYDEGLGTLATVIGNFFAVVLIGGLIYVAWNVIAQFKSSGQNNSMFGEGGGKGPAM